MIPGLRKSVRIQRKPIRRKRSKARRGRLVDPKFRAWMYATQPCLLLGKHTCIGAVDWHHVREFGSPKNDRRTLMLCAGGHLECWPDGIHRLGKEAWQERFGIDIEAEIERYNEQYELR